MLAVPVEHQAQKMLVAEGPADLVVLAERVALRVVAREEARVAAVTVAERMA